MDNLLSTVKIVIVVIGGFLIGLLGGWDTTLKILIIFVAMDYVTGVLAAWYEKKLDSNVGLFGIAKKILLFVPVGLGYWLDVLLGTEILRSLAICFYIANEGLSITENLGRVGVPIPAAIKDTLEQLRKKQESKST